jgi:hypothetical protein
MFLYNCGTEAIVPGDERSFERSSWNLQSLQARKWRGNQPASPLTEHYSILLMLPFRNYYFFIEKKTVIN